ncbi:nickel/cobalt efflux transporter RcnA (plasmid) [Roseomonas sp. OT10]|uniref:nickel/cobalt efflux transporter n=1 Tax=Roseomonas cutis TaxID=2897332 RepID=UPI001E4119F9|nr:nickel/cobalt efflux transporter [Roseomonas sp. OT10]UFN51706.1 nickel/cobalt efflux transporter RcnA [Roseomonas sp. OT10]
MTPFSDLIAQGSAHAWLFIPSAILLGALHGLEPGHSKTMMAAFIVAVRGTVGQAVLLGLAATVSHTAVVWAIGLGGLYLWQGLDAEASEPWFQLASAVAIIGLAVWMLVRTWRDQRDMKRVAGSHDHGSHAHGGGHGHDHPHHHGEEVRRIHTGHGMLALEVYEDGVPPRWRLRAESGHGWAARDVTVETLRPDGSRQSFAFVERDGYLESVAEIPEPHEFQARLSLSHGSHSHDYDLRFAEHGHNGHGHAEHAHDELAGLSVGADGYQDAHERAHARDIQRQFANRRVTTWQIVLFGLTGGLIPCPAAITVLLICLQLQELSLALVLVLCFSIGLAITMVAIGAAAAVGMRQVSRRWAGFDDLVRKAPFASGALIILVGLYVGVSAVMHLAA